jgi:hypothetical protein
MKNMLKAEVHLVIFWAAANFRKNLLSYFVDSFIDHNRAEEIDSSIVLFPN